MARRTRTRRIYVRPKRRSYRRKGGGKTNNLLWGFVAGLAGNLLSKYIGSYGHPAAAVGIGWWKNNQVLQVEGARELGSMIGSQLPFIGGGGAVGGGSY
jgi:hypothetical protein